MSNDPYELLGVPRTASAIEIHAAYRRLCAELRPDGIRGGEKTEARFREVDAAYEILSDARRRTEYDQSGVIPPPSEPRPPGSMRSVPPVEVPDVRHGERSPVVDHRGVGELAFFPLIAGGVFLYYGFNLLPGDNGVAAYDFAIDLFRWMARIVGVGLLVVAGLAFMKQPAARVLDLVISSLACLGCLIVGGIWIFYGDNDGLLILLLAAVNGWSAQAAWQQRTAA